METIPISRFKARCLAVLQRVRRTGKESPDNELWLSPISRWELLQLIDKGRLTIDKDPIAWVDEVSRAVALREAALTHEVAIASRSLDLSHDDPADRFLAATARVHGLPLVTADDRLLGSRRFATLANR